MKKKVGRPIEFGPDIITQARAYLKSREDEEVERGSENRPEYTIKVKLPTIEGLALFLSISRDTVYDWEKKYQDFSDILSDLRNEQADKLINNGLSGDYNPTIAKVLLTKHGYREGIENTGEGGGPIKHDINAQLLQVYGGEGTT